jgi:hypothetical protein
LIEENRRGMLEAKGMGCHHLKIRAKQGTGKGDREKKKGCQNRRRLTTNKGRTIATEEHHKQKKKNTTCIRARGIQPKRWGICREPHKKAERKPKIGGKKGCSRQANTQNPGI